MSCFIKSPGTAQSLITRKVFITPNTANQNTVELNALNIRSRRWCRVIKKSTGHEAADVVEKGHAFVLTF